MDPISAVFATYIDLVSSQATTAVSDLLGTEVQAVVVQHRKMSIPYSYQAWKIQDQTVCATYRQNFPLFSRCTINAQDLFQETCTHLQANQQTHWKQQKMKNMYCTAATTFQPVVASIEWSSEASPVAEARTQCNLAVAELMGDRSTDNLKKQELACGKYHELRGKLSR